MYIAHNIFSFKTIIRNLHYICSLQQREASEILNAGKELDSNYIQNSLLNIRKAEEDLEKFSTVLLKNQKSSSDLALREIAKENLENIKTKRILIKEYYDFFMTPKEINDSNDKMNKIWEYSYIDLYQDLEKQLLKWRYFEKQIFVPFIQHADNELKDVIQSLSSLSPTFIKTVLGFMKNSTPTTEIKYELNEKIKEYEELFIDIRKSANDDISNIAEQF